MQKTILLTGSAGFIGSHTAHTLLEQGHVVVGLDNLNDYYSPDWKRENLARLSQHQNFTFIEGDILDSQLLDKLATNQKFQTIIHLAARAGVRPSIEQPLLYQQVNVEGTLKLLELARAHHINQFIYASSSSVYGNQTKTPFSETDRCDTPVSPYAATKRATELLAHTYHHLYGIQATGLRFFTVYGPDGRPDMAPYLFTKAILTDQPIKKFGDGSTRRDYTYIDDIVAGVVACLDLQTGCEVINLGNNIPVTLNEFIQTLEDITGKEMQLTQLPMQPGDVTQTYADISKAQQLLGYNPTTSFHEGMTKFVEWFKENRL